MHIPTICAVEGHCLDAAFELAIACDLRIATPGSRFGFAEGSAAGIAEIDAVFHHPQTREIVRKAVGGFS